MKDHQLKVKKSKCSFMKSQVDYLGHIIDKDGVHADPKKVDAIQNWSVPKNLKELRGFLGLSGYYRRFIKDYGKISRSLTNLLKKNSFKWESFQQLKLAMGSPPVLALPNFTKTFVVETDASNTGIGAILLQE